MLAVITLMDGTVHSADFFASSNVGLAEAVNFLTLKKLAFGSIVSYSIQTLDGEVYLTI